MAILFFFQGTLRILLVITERQEGRATLITLKCTNFDTREAIFKLLEGRDANKMVFRWN